MPPPVAQPDVILMGSAAHMAFPVIFTFAEAQEAPLVGNWELVIATHSGGLRSLVGHSPGDPPPSRAFGA